MASVRIDVVFQGVSGLPKDRFVNVLYFNGGPADTPSQVAHGGFLRINQMYQSTLGTYWSPASSPVVQLFAYNLADPTPRPIINSATITMGAFPGRALPEEVALCISYFTDRNIPSHRGRLYLGPLNDGAMSGSPSRPAVAFRNAVAAAGRDMIAGIGFAPNIVVHGDTTFGTILGWALHSPKLGTTVAIGGGWVDDAWDTQRRRGVAAGTRTIFSPVLP